MKNIFDLEVQNQSLDSKIVAGFERLSQVFRVLLWEKAKKHEVTPIQIQLLIFIKYHIKTKTTVSYLAKEFNLTKATVSDTIKILEQKNYIQKEIHFNDSRSYTITLTPKGTEMVHLTENFADPVYDIIASASNDDKNVLWKNISSIMEQLHHFQVINVQSTCFNCSYFLKNNNEMYCRLMEIQLETRDLRLDCSDHRLKVI